MSLQTELKVEWQYSPKTQSWNLALHCNTGYYSTQNNNLLFVHTTWYQVWCHWIDWPDQTTSFIFIVGTFYSPQLFGRDLTLAVLMKPHWEDIVQFGFVFAPQLMSLCVAKIHNHFDHKIPKMTKHHSYIFLGFLCMHFF